MKLINLIGPVDKRTIAYPLFKASDVMGRVLVITDDGNFTRFSEDYTKTFTVGRSDFVVTHEVGEFLKGVNTSAYDFIICITTNELIENSDRIIYCHGAGNNMCSKDILNVFLEYDEDDSKDKPYEEVLIVVNKPKKVTVSNVITIDGKTMSYVWGCEEDKYFLPCKSGSLVAMCKFLFAETLGIKDSEFEAVIVKEV